MLVVTDIETNILHWKLGPVVHSCWVYGGKLVHSYVFAKNGQRYVPPKPPDDPLVAYYTAECGMKKVAARLMARKIPKNLPEAERMMLALQVYDKEGR